MISRHTTSLRWLDRIAVALLLSPAVLLGAATLGFTG